MRILKIETLENKKERSWIDRDEIMLHACFQLLKDAIEKEKVDEHCNYEAHKESVDELRFLYQWWGIRKNRPYDVDESKEDDEMLNRLMKVRSFLWT